MKIKNLVYNFEIAGEAIFHHKLRSVLTSLGIIFGVASVITMLAIGSGAEKEILEKMKLLGTNVIIIKPLDKKELQELEKQHQDEQEETNQQASEKVSITSKYTPGLTISDADAIKNILSNIDKISPEIIFETLAMKDGFKRNINLVGVEQSYFDINNFKITEGNMFNSKNLTFSESVCIIGVGVRTRLFPGTDAVGKTIKCGNHWLTIIGVISEQNISKENIKNLDLRDYNYDVYIPINTMLLRFVNRSLVTKADLQRNGRFFRTTSTEDDNYHQIDKIKVSFRANDKIRESGDLISKVLERRHNGVKDFEVVIPEVLLQQEQETKKIFNFVLGAIASISLLVGGIGIMNIMLASVLERTKEIGIRKAVGAKRTDIMIQFLSEAVSISLTGGLIGIVVGILASYLIEFITDINTIVTTVSVILSFFVSISVGIVFGITPARKASLEDPINLLRYE